MAYNMNRKVSFTGYGLSFEETPSLYPRVTAWCPARAEPFDEESFFNQKQIHVEASFLAQVPHEWSFPSEAPEIPYVGFVIKDTGGNSSHGAHHDTIRREVGFSTGRLFALSSFDDIAALIGAQMDGREGVLLTNSRRNLFYIQGPGCVSGIGCYFDKQFGWYLEGFDAGRYESPDSQVLFPVFKKPYMPTLECADERTIIKEETFLSRLLKLWQGKTAIKTTKNYVCRSMSVVPARTRPVTMAHFLKHVKADAGFVALTTLKQLDLPRGPTCYTQLRLHENYAGFEREDLLKLLPEDPFVPGEDIVFLILREWQRKPEVLDHEYNGKTVFFTKGENGSPVLVRVSCYFGRWSIETTSDMAGIEYLNYGRIIVRGRVEESKVAARGEDLRILSYLME